MKVHVLVHLKADVLDVQGQAIQQAVTSAGHRGVGGVRVGKSFYLDVDLPSQAALRDEVEKLCHETLCNPLIETYEWEVVPS